MTGCLAFLSFFFGLRKGGENLPDYQRNQQNRQGEDKDKLAGFVFRGSRRGRFSSLDTLRRARGSRRGFCCFVGWFFGFAWRVCWCWRFRSYCAAGGFCCWPLRRRWFPLRRDRRLLSSVFCLALRGSRCRGGVFLGAGLLGRAHTGCRLLFDEINELLIACFFRPVDRRPGAYRVAHRIGNLACFETEQEEGGFVLLAGFGSLERKRNVRVELAILSHRVCRKTDHDNISSMYRGGNLLFPFCPWQQDFLIEPGLNPFCLRKPTIDLACFLPVSSCIGKKSAYWLMSF